MWIIHLLIGDAWILWCIYALLGLGGVLILITFLSMNNLLKKFPDNARAGVVWTKVIYLASLVVAIAGAYVFSGYGTEMEWIAKGKSLEAKVAIAEKKSSEATTKIIYLTKEKIIKVRQNIESIKKEIEVNKDEIDKYPISPKAVEIYNKAVAGPEVSK